MDIRDCPLPLRALVFFRNTVVYLFVLGVAVACLVVGSTLGRLVGGVLFLACLVLGVRLVRGRLKSRSEKLS
jgi:hypothetical protein